MSGRNKKSACCGTDDCWCEEPRHGDSVALFDATKSGFVDLVRVCKICVEFIKGFWVLRKHKHCVSVFGSARFNEDHEYYKLARQVGALIAHKKYTVITGGGPGIMEAANRGAQEAGGHSIGCNIQLPKEQAPNPYLDKWIDFRYFFVRKVMLVKYSSIFVIMPGGYGTLDELFEALTLMQTKKINAFPIILMGSEFWQDIIPIINERFVASGTISEGDPDLFILTDSLEEVGKCMDTCMCR